MTTAEYAKAVAQIREDYEARLERARHAYDACREALEAEHSRAMAAESLLNHPVLLDLFGRIEDGHSTAFDPLWPLVKEFTEMRDEVMGE